MSARTEIEAQIADLTASRERWASRHASAAARHEARDADALLLPEEPERAAARLAADEARRDAAGALRQVEQHDAALAALSRRLAAARLAEDLAARKERERRLAVLLDASDAATRAAAEAIRTAGQRMGEALDAAQALARAVPEHPLGLQLQALREALAVAIRRETPEAVVLTNNDARLAPPDPAPAIRDAFAAELRRADLIRTKE
jgi:hypothetical protein